ncbi:MAG: hypothetical protein PVF65_01000 [Sphingomonadales bacterium]|jgi:hypothetical protein
MWEFVVGWYEALTPEIIFLIVITILLASAVLSDPRAVKRLAQIVFVLIVGVFLLAAYHWTRQPVVELDAQQSATPDAPKDTETPENQ